jgi:hypothetical protein
MRGWLTRPEEDLAEQDKELASIEDPLKIWYKKYAGYT